MIVKSLLNSQVSRRVQGRPDFIFGCASPAISQTSLHIAVPFSVADICISSLFDVDEIRFTILHPDQAFLKVIQREVDIAVVLGNIDRSKVISKELLSGHLQLYAKEKEAPLKPIIVPEHQHESFTFKQAYTETTGDFLPVRLQIPCMSIIANVCSKSSEIGLLPDFLANKHQLHPVSWNRTSIPYRIFAFHQEIHDKLSAKFDLVINKLHEAFANI